MFNLLRLQARPATAALQTARRCYATAFVPPASLKEGLATPLPVEPKLKPDSPTFYTARAGYFDGLTALEDAITDTRRALTALQLLPLPQSVRKALPPLQPVWHTKDTLAGHLSAIVTTSKYRRYIRVLDQLNEYRQIAEIAGVVELAENLADIITSFERENKEAVLAHGKKKPVQFDEYGRSYTLGRRKESTARVWVIPVKTPEAAVSQSALQTESPGELSHFIPQPLTTPTKMLPVTTTNIIVNNTPFIEYFPQITDRERAILPLKIAGLLGAYNVFAIVRGGGTTGQSGALSLGIAKGLAAHVPEVAAILAKAKLLRRDPRMVERKKTGLAKSHKAYGWVKR